MFHLKSLASSIRVIGQRSLENGFHTSAACSSVFMKRQKKIDPEIAKVREIRKRKKLEREIREMQKHSKKVKPVDEIALDIKSAKNIHERTRKQVTLTEQQADERTLIAKEYCRSRNTQMRHDDQWIRQALYMQKKALAELKTLSPHLYEEAVKNDLGNLPHIIDGPALTSPVKNYDPPDGDYVDTTRTWT
ncbi:unnamed protein product, partial [Mesorhabditis belari]|uniref:Large ribosomal subunit protein mL40 n=1 Tax=Mesorhabditis belari TaxID=2138241 RepID=A0AAF3EA88_9BILA